MGRKVSVGLEADVGSFIPPVEAAKKSVDGLDDKVKALDRDLGKIPGDAAKAGASMKLLGGDVDGVGKKLTMVQEKSTALTVLDSKIRTSRNEVRKLADEFAKTGSADVFKKLGSENANLLNLGTMRKKLSSELKAGFEDGAKTGASTFSATIQGAMQGLPSEIKLAVVAAIGAAALLAAPLLVSAVGGAILAGVGALGLGAAIALAVQDPKVMQAFGEVGTHIMRQLDDVVAPFKAELMDVPDIFYAGWQKILPALSSGVFQPLVNQVKPLAEGLVGFVERLTPGLAKAGPAAAAIVGMISDALPMLGAAAGHFLEAISGPGATEALRAILVGIEFAIYATGDFIGALETVFGWFSKISLAVGSLFYDNLDQPKAIAGALYEVSDAAGTVAASTHLTQAELAGLSETMNSAVVTADTLAGAMSDKLLDAMFRVQENAIGLEQSYDDLSDSLKKNGKNFDIHTQKGRDNYRALLNVIKANKDIYDTMIANNATAEEAANAWNTNTDALRRQLKAAGLSDDKIKELIGDMGSVPNSVNSTIAIEGLTKAINNLNETLRLINGLDGKTATSTVFYRKVIQTFYETYGSMADAREGFRTGANSKRALGGIRRAATGMLISPSDPGTTLVGEPQTGGEALIPLRGISQSSAMSLMSVVGDAYGLDVSARFRSSGPYQPMARPSQGGSSPIDARAFGAEVRRALAGVAVLLDGQRVGYVQGLSADYQRRGG